MMNSIHDYLSYKRLDGHELTRLSLYNRKLPGKRRKPNGAVKTMPTTLKG